MHCSGIVENLELGNAWKSSSPSLPCLSLPSFLPSLSLSRPLECDIWWQQFLPENQLTWLCISLQPYLVERHYITVWPYLLVLISFGEQRPPKIFWRTVRCPSHEVIGVADEYAREKFTPSWRQTGRVAGVALIHRWKGRISLARKWSDLLAGILWQLHPVMGLTLLHRWAVVCRVAMNNWRVGSVGDRPKLA